MILFVTP